MVLADGMGGMAGGAQASRVVVESFLHTFQESEGPATLRFNQCLDEASSRLRELVKDDPSLEGMGSTVVAVHYDGKEISWLSVGDSPMWLYSDEKLMRLNSDHSMAQVLDRLVESGELTEEEALNDGRRNMLLSAVTGSKVELVDSAKCSCRLLARDRLLIASDGIQTLSDEDIERQLNTIEGTSDIVADALLSAVKTAADERQDNLTFLLLSGDTFEDDAKDRVTASETDSREAGSSSQARYRFSPSILKILGVVLAVVGLLILAIFTW